AFTIDPDSLLDPKRGLRTFTAPCELSTVVLAEKGPASTTAVWPAQDQYRAEQDWAVYRRNLMEMKRSPRPHILRSHADLKFFDATGGYLFINRVFDPLDPKQEEARLRGMGPPPRNPSLFQRFKYLIIRMLRLMGYEIIKTVKE